MENDNEFNDILKYIKKSTITTIGYNCISEDMINELLSKIIKNRYK